MFSKGKYFLLQTGLIILSPITSLLVSLRLYKSAISQFFFVIFAMYLGYYMGFVFDLMRHYWDIPMLYRGRDWYEINHDLRTFALGKDYYHVIFKYIFSRFSEDRQWFGACASGVYSLSFLFFFRELKQFYNLKVPEFCTMMLLLAVTVVEFYWYQGFRFWFGVYIFLGIYMRYLNTGRWWYLLFEPIVILIHFSHTTLVAALLLDLALRVIGNWARWCLLGFALFIQSLNMDFVPLMLRFMPWTASLGRAYTDDFVRENTLNRLANIRATINSIYFSRSHFLLFFSVFALLLMKRCYGKFDKKYRNLFFMALTLYTVACFGYGDLIFYGRFVKAAVLMLCTYTYIISVQTYKAWQRYNLFMFIFALGLFVFTFAMSFTQMRNFLFYPEILFGNFWVDFDGNELNMHYDWQY